MKECQVYKNIKMAMIKPKS